VFFFLFPVFTRHPLVACRSPFLPERPLTLNMIFTLVSWSDLFSRPEVAPASTCFFFPFCRGLAQSFLLGPRTGYRPSLFVSPPAGFKLWSPLAFSEQCAPLQRPIDRCISFFFLCVAKQFCKEGGFPLDLCVDGGRIFLVPCHFFVDVLSFLEI